MTETEGPEVGLTETTPVPTGVESTAKARVEQQSRALGLLWGGGGKLRSDLEALLEQCATGREGQGGSCCAFNQNISTAMLEFDWGTDMCLGVGGCLHERHILVSLASWPSYLDLDLRMAVSPLAA